MKQLNHFLSSYQLSLLFLFVLVSVVEGEAVTIHMATANDLWLKVKRSLRVDYGNPNRTKLPLAAVTLSRLV